MKKEELKFKCVVPDEKSETYLIKKMREIGFCKSIITCGHAFVMFNGAWSCNSSASRFCDWPEPLVSYEQALEMIAQVEPEQKGEWVEFEVDENGNYRPRPDAALFNWQDNYIGGSFIFGGWLWELRDSTTNWSCFKIGADKSGLSTTCASNWVKPLQPKKIRFWRVEK